MNLETIINNFVTSGLHLSDPDLLRRFKVLNVFQLVFIMMAPILGLFFFYIGALSLFYCFIVAGLFMILGIILLRKTKNIIFVGNYAVFVLWATISVIAWNSGAITFEGIINPSWLLNAGLILLAIFLNGYLSGTVWATVVFIQTGIVIYLFRMGYEFTNIIPPEITATYFMGTYLVCLLAILLFAFLFEKEKSEALIREQEKASALRESKRYMDDIFDRYPLPTFVIDRSHRVIQWNRACRELSSISIERILGKKVWEGFAINDKGSFADILLEDMDSITSDYGEFIISQTDTGWFELEAFLPNLKNGQRVIITAAPIAGDDGIVRGAIQTIQELHKIPTEAGIQEVLNETFPRPVYRIDSGGKIDFWNKACEDKFGYPASQMIGKSPLTIVAKRYRPLFKDMFVRVLKGESFVKLEWRYQASNGSPVYVIARAFPSEHSDGESVECIIENTDVTDLRLKLKKLSLYAAESNEKLKTLSEDYDLLKKNIAMFIRKKDKQADSPPNE